MTATPLIDRIADRRGRVGPVCPVPILERMSEFSRRLAEKRLPVTDTSQFYNGASVPVGERGAA